MRQASSRGRPCPSHRAGALARSQVHCEIEYESQQGSFEAGDKVERHITNTVTPRGHSRSGGPGLGSGRLSRERVRCFTPLARAERTSAGAKNLADSHSLARHGAASTISGSAKKRSLSELVGSNRLLPRSPPKRLMGAGCAHPDDTPEAAKFATLDSDEELNGAPSSARSDVMPRPRELSPDGCELAIPARARTMEQT